MKQYLILSVVSAALAAFNVAAVAQTTAIPNDRASVRAEAASAAKAGATKGGEILPPARPTAKSMQSREVIKADTKAADAKGDLNRAGERASPPAKPAMSTKTREDVKAETRAATKAGELPRAGEITASQPKK